MLNSSANDFLPSLSPQYLIDETVGERKVFYRLGESELFQYANKSTHTGGLALIDVIPRMVTTDGGFDHIGLDHLDKAVKYELFESAKYKLSCKKTIMNLIDSGEIVMVYSDQYRIPSSIPYIVQAKDNRSCKIYVNVSDFLTMNQYGIYEITQPRNYNAMISILVAATVAYRIVKSTNTLPADIADTMVLMYAGMFEKVVNSMVHMDPTMREKMKYLATEFALIQMYGTETGTQLFYRYKNKYFPKLSSMITDAIDNQFKLDHFDNLTLFIEELKANYPSMKGLNTYLFYDKWIRSFGPATAMAVDYLGFHIYTICMVLFESPLINRVSLEPVLEKSKGTELYKRIQQFIG